MEKNREIKFRAWDVKFNVMLTNVVVWDSETECIAVLDQPAQWAYGDKLDERMEIDFEGSVPEWYCFTGGFHIMQFTGLRDKNRVDIYEGDIVKGENGKTGEVKQLEGGQYYIDHDSVSLKYQYQVHCEICDAVSPVFFLNFYEPYAIEVIGNIYKHPELLKP